MGLFGTIEQPTLLLVATFIIKKLKSKSGQAFVYIIQLGFLIHIEQLFCDFVLKDEIDALSLLF